MQKALILLASILLLAAGCSRNIGNPDAKVRTVKTELTEQNGLEHWALALTPKIDAAGRQAYDLTLRNAGDAAVSNATVYLRVDTKEKLSAPIIKADSKTVVSKLGPNEAITLSELKLPVDTPISVGVDWLAGNTISKGTGTLRITELK